jgi:predicted RNase H-like HicB family nuclease
MRNGWGLGSRWLARNARLSICHRSIRASRRMLDRSCTTGRATPQRSAGRLRWSGDDHLFVAEVPELPGCMAHGMTPAEAVASAEEAITSWIRPLGRTSSPSGHSGVWLAAEADAA